jgi:hypothetical protein
MHYNHTSRRYFLQGAGASVLGLPFLTSLAPKLCKASESLVPPIKRMVLMRGINGSVSQNRYAPQGPASLFQQSILPGIGKDAGPLTIRQATLSQIAASQGALSECLPASFNSALSKMWFWHGFDMPRKYGHFTGQTFGNMGAYGNTNPSDAKKTPTIDEVAAYSASYYPATWQGSKRCVVAMPNSSSNPDSNCFYGYSNPLQKSGDIVRRSVYHTADNLFRALFQQYLGQSSGEPADTTLVDAVYEDYTRLKNNSRLSREDRAKLESHLSFIQEMQQKVLASGQVCTVPDEPESLGKINGLDIIGHQKTYELYNDVIVAAMRCDLCRVFSMPIVYAEGRRSGSASTPGDWHYWSHNASASQEELVKINRWINEKVFLDLITKLDSVSETEGTLLDECLVLRTDEHGFSTHCETNLYMLGAGSAGGQLKGDHYVDFRDQSSPYSTYELSQSFRGQVPGILYNRLLANLLSVMGVASAEYEAYNPSGQKGYGDHSFHAPGVAGSAKEQRRWNHYTPQLSSLSTPLAPILT